MSYYEYEPSSVEGRVGQAIYMKALSDRRGFRYDQLGIHDAEIWQDILEDLGRIAIEVVAAESTP